MNSGILQTVFLGCASCLVVSAFLNVLQPTSYYNVQPRTTVHISRAAATLNPTQRQFSAPQSYSQVFEDQETLSTNEDRHESHQNTLTPSFSLFTLVSVASLFGGYVVGRLFQRQPVALASYQSESRREMFLRAAAEEDPAAKLGALLKEASEKMEGALEATSSKFNTIRTGRANPALLDRVRVDYYGALTPLKQMAGVTVPDASTIVVSPFDRSSMTAIEKAIASSDLGFTPSNDGERIRISVPPLTEDRRKEMVKVMNKMGEEGKVAIRNVRRDVLKSADKMDLSENAQEGFKADVQKLTDASVTKLEQLVKAKEKDLTTV